MTISKPMLAGKCGDMSKLALPVYATPKLDGVRALMIHGKLTSRKWKAIPNDHVRDTLERRLPDWMDGELMLVKSRDENGVVQSYHKFNQVSSAVMRSTGEPDFVYMVFDMVADELTETYHDRMEFLRKWFGMQPAKVLQCVALVDYTKIETLEELERYEEWAVTEGFEGVMVRTPNSPYKCGRSTEKEGWLLKIKRFIDAEATVVGFTEEFKNNNVAEKDAFGRTKRSSHKANKIGKGVMGNLICTMPGCTQFEIGTGFDHAERREIWENQDKYKGKLVKFRYQKIDKDKPLFSSFLGWRHEDDTGGEEKEE